jgi:phospholipid transport system substrate-binding protein
MLRPPAAARLVLLVSLLAPGLARAGADAPRDALLDAERRARAALAQEAAPAEIARVTGDAFDFEELSRRALGSAWKAESAAGRARFVALLRAVIEGSYLPRVKGAPDVRFAVGESARDGADAVVPASAASDEREVPLAFRLRQRQGRWVVCDVAIDGVGLVETYAEQFRRVLAKGGMKALVAALERRRDELAREAARR